jgi:hypothetical protein
MPPQHHWEISMKIKIIGDREVWFDDQPQVAGYVGEVDDAVGENLIALGMAEKVVARQQKAADTK